MKNVSLKSYPYNVTLSLTAYNAIAMLYCAAGNFLARNRRGTSTLTPRAHRFYVQLRQRFGRIRKQNIVQFKELHDWYANGCQPDPDQVVVLTLSGSRDLIELMKLSYEMSSRDLTDHDYIKGELLDELKELF
jgi:hypothetical protein